MILSDYCSSNPSVLTENRHATQIIIRLKPHPKGSAKAVVSLCSAELFVLNNKTISSLKKVGGVIFIPSMRILTKNGVFQDGVIRHYEHAFRPVLRIDVRLGYSFQGLVMHQGQRRFSQQKTELAQ